jgi:hypothetical protein
MSHATGKLIIQEENRLFGFLLGSTLSGAGMYYYVLNEYRVSNELLTEDIFVSFFSELRGSAWRRDGKEGLIG